MDGTGGTIIVRSLVESEVERIKLSLINDFNLKMNPMLLSSIGLKTGLGKYCKRKGISIESIFECDDRFVMDGTGGTITVRSLVESEVERILLSLINDFNLKMNPMLLSLIGLKTGLGEYCKKKGISMKSIFERDDRFVMDGTGGTIIVRSLVESEVERIKLSLINDFNLKMNPMRLSLIGLKTGLGKYCKSKGISMKSIFERDDRFVMDGTGGTIIVRSLVESE